MELLGERGRVKFKITKHSSYYYKIEARCPYFKKYNKSTIYFVLWKSSSRNPHWHHPTYCYSDYCEIDDYYVEDGRNTIYNCHVYINDNNIYVDEIKFYVD